MFNWMPAAMLLMTDPLSQKIAAVIVADALGYWLWGVFVPSLLP